MKSRTVFSSKEEAERKTPYVLVSFEVFDNRTFASIVKSFSTKKAAETYISKFGSRGCELMTRVKYNKEASNAM